MILVLLVLSVFTLFQSASTTPRIFLEKELRFGRTTIVDIVSLTLSSLLGILAALMNFGLWSLVVLNVSGMVFTFFGLFFVSNWKFQFSFNREMMRWFLKFGIYLWIGGVTTFIIFQYNDFIIGTFVSATILGFYSKAFQLAQLPTSLVTSIISRVALPTYSKLQNDTEKLSTVFNLVLRNIFRISAPLSIMLFLVAEEFTRIFLSDKWLPMVPLLQLFLIYLLIRPVFDDTGAFLTAIGKPQVISKYLSVQAAILLVLTPLLVKFGQEKGAVVSLNIVMVLGVVMAYYYANRHVKIHFREIFLPTMLASLLTLAGYYLLTYFLPINHLNIFFIFVIKVLIFGVSYLGWVLLLERKQIKEDLGLFIGIIKKKNVEI
jgi:O-antigen/teichoic acid export membrane protein